MSFSAAGPKILSAGSLGTDVNNIRKVTSNTANDIYVVGSTNVAGSNLYGITGLNKSGTTQDGLLLRFNSAGTNLTYRLYSGNGATVINSIRKDTASESTYVVGQTQATGTDLFGIPGLSPVNANGDAFLAKYSDANTLQWSKVIGGSGVENSTAVHVDAAGNVYMVGTTSTSGQTLGAPGVNKQNTAPGGFVVKLSPSGSTLWGAEYSIAGTTTNFTAVSTDKDGNIIFAGTTTATGTNLFGITGLNRPSGQTGIFIVKQNPTTNQVLYAQIYNSSTTEVVNALVTDNRNNFYIGGTTRTITSNMFGITGLNKTTNFVDGYLVQLNASGVPQWGRLFQQTVNPSNSFSVSVNDVSIYPGGRLILTGSTTTPAIVPNMFGITGLNKTVPNPAGFVIAYDRDTVANPWFQMLEGGNSAPQVGFLNQYKKLVIGIQLSATVTNLYGFVGANKSGINTDIAYITYEPPMEPPSPPIINPRPKTRNGQITYSWYFEDTTTVAYYVINGPQTVNLNTLTQIYYTFTGLSNGQSYSCSITSFNAEGTPSPIQTYNDVIPGLPCPKPENVAFIVNGNTLTVNWDEPANDGDSPIGWYVIQTPARQLRQGIEPWRRSYTINVPSGTYTFELRAITDTGYGFPATSQAIMFP